MQQNLPARRDGASAASPSMTCIGRLKWGDGSESDIAAATRSLTPTTNSDDDCAWLALRIKALRSLFFRADDDEPMEDATAAMWFEALHQFPRWSIERACREYIAAHGRKEPPAPGDIVRACRGMIAEIRFALDRQQQTDMDRRARRPPPTPEQRARVQKLVDSLTGRRKGERRVTDG